MLIILLQRLSTIAVYGKVNGDANIVAVSELLAAGNYILTLLLQKFTP